MVDQQFSPQEVICSLPCTNLKHNPITTPWEKNKKKLIWLRHVLPTRPDLVIFHCALAQSVSRWEVAGRSARDASHNFANEMLRAASRDKLHDTHVIQVITMSLWKKLGPIKSGARQRSAAPAINLSPSPAKWPAIRYNGCECCADVLIARELQITLADKSDRVEKVWMSTNMSNMSKDGIKDQLCKCASWNLVRLSVVVFLRFAL